MIDGGIYSMMMIESKITVMMLMVADEVVKWIR